MYIGLSRSRGQATGKDTDRKESETAVKHLAGNKNIILEIVPPFCAEAPGPVSLGITDQTPSVPE